MLWNYEVQLCTDRLLVMLWNYELQLLYSAQIAY